MRKQIFLGLVLAATLGACNQNSNVTPATTTATGAGRTATDSFGKGVTITADQLPAAATTYLTTNYAGYTLIQAVQGTDRAGATFYAVVIEQSGVRYHLHFDAAGAFVASKGGHGPGPNDANETTITADKLPAAITDYLNTTYAGYTLVQAEQAADAAGVVMYYETVITSSGKTFQLNFDATGKLLERGKGGPGKGGAPQGTQLTADKLPAAVTTYLTANYAGYTFGDAYQATTRDGVTVYAVMITQNSTKYFLLFDANGAFVSVRTKKH